MNTLTKTRTELDYVFNKLLVYLQPTETKSRKQTYNVYSAWSNLIHKKTENLIFAECNFSNAENIPVPENITLNITEQLITIQNGVYQYQFAPDQILTVWNRLKKIKEL